MRRTLVFLAVALLSAGCFQPVSGYDEQEGGYVYRYTDPSEDRFLDNVWNFIKYFDMNYDPDPTKKYEQRDQYYWCESPGFDKYNNAFLDAVDFAYYSGHGSPWYLTMGPGAEWDPNYVYLYGNKWAGNHKGWGNRSLEFITFQSCAVIPCPEEYEDWYSNWITEPVDVFDGLHQAIGYHTISYSGNGISDNYGNRIKNNDEAVWQAWFNAVDDERSGFYPGYASAVMYPDCDGESYGNQVPDPPGNHTTLKIWYQVSD